LAEKEVFVRKASGLVKEVSWKDALFFNVSYAFPWGGVGIILLSYPWVASGGSLTLGILLCAIGSAFHISMYALLAMTMPRSGGDYVWVSRILHPAIGFAQSLVIVVGGFFWFGTGPGALILFVRNMIAIVGGMENNVGLVNSASVLNIPWVITLIGIVLSILYAYITFFRVKQFFRVQTTLIAIMFLGVFILIGLSLFTDHATFITRFNNIAAVITGDHNYSQTLINQATNDTLLPIPQLSGAHWMWATVSVMPLAFWTFSYPYFSAYIAGEWKEAKRTALISFLGGLAVCALVILLTTTMLLNVAGEPLIQALADGYYGHPSTYWGIAPYAYMYAAGMTDNVILVIIVFIAYCVMQVLFNLVSLLYVSRCIFAWAFDRVVPERLGSVSAKYHIPIPAIALSGVACILFFLLFQYVYGLALELTISIVIATLMFSYVIVGITGIVFPWRRKEIYETSPIQYKVLGLPLISLIGIIDVGFLVSLAYFYMSQSAYGAFDWGSYIFFLVLFCAGVVGYYVSRAYRKKQKIDLDLTFREIPPA